MLALMMEEECTDTHGHTSHLTLISQFTEDTTLIIFIILIRGRSSSSSRSNNTRSTSWKDEEMLRIYFARNKVTLSESFRKREMK